MSRYEIMSKEETMNLINIFIDKMGYIDFSEMGEYYSDVLTEKIQEDFAKFCVKLYFSHGSKMVSDPNVLFYILRQLNVNIDTVDDIYALRDDAYFDSMPYTFNLMYRNYVRNPSENNHKIAILAVECYKLIANLHYEGTLGGLNDFFQVLDDAVGGTDFFSDDEDEEEDDDEEEIEVNDDEDDEYDYDEDEDEDEDDEESDQDSNDYLSMIRRLLELGDVDDVEAIISNYRQAVIGTIKFVADSTLYSLTLPEISTIRKLFDDAIDEAEILSIKPGLEIPKLLLTMKDLQLHSSLEAMLEKVFIQSYCHYLADFIDSTFGTYHRIRRLNMAIKNVLNELEFEENRDFATEILEEYDEEDYGFDEDEKYKSLYFDFFSHDLSNSHNLVILEHLNINITDYYSDLYKLSAMVLNQVNGSLDEIDFENIFTQYNKGLLAQNGVFVSNLKYASSIYEITSLNQIKQADDEDMIDEVSGFLSNMFECIENITYKYTLQNTFDYSSNSKSANQMLYEYAMYHLEDISSSGEVDFDFSLDIFKKLQNEICERVESVINYLGLIEADCDDITSTMDHVEKVLDLMDSAYSTIRESLEDEE